MAALNDSVMQTRSAPRTVAYTGTAGESTAITGVETKNVVIVRLTATSDCFWRAGRDTGATPATSSNGEFLPSGVVEYKKINAGDKISVVQSSAGGSLYITEQF